MRWWYVRGTQSRPQISHSVAMALVAEGAGGGVVTVVRYVVRMGARKVVMSSAGGVRIPYVVRDSEISGSRVGVILSEMSLLVSGRAYSSCMPGLSAQTRWVIVCSSGGRLSNTIEAM